MTAVSIESPKGTTKVNSRHVLRSYWDNQSRYTNDLRSGKSDKDADMSDDAYLEAHPEKRPVVVIDNFLHKNQEGSIVYDKIAEW